MMKKRLISIILAVLFVSTLAFTGCTSGIPANRLSYFKGLNNQKFWTDKPLSVEMEKDDGQKVTLSLGTKKGVFEGIEFGEAKITKSSDKGVPQKGYILVKIIDDNGKELSSYHIDINENNESAIKNLISRMENNQQKVVIEESKKLIDSGNFAAAISKLKSIRPTDEVEKLLDLIAQHEQQLLSDAKTLMGKAEYSKAKEKLLELKKLNNSTTVNELWNELNDKLSNTWLMEASDIRDAIAYGKNNKNTSFESFMGPWTINRNKNSTISCREYISVTTPYLLVATLALSNAEKYKDTTLNDALNLLKSIKTLEVSAEVYGDKIDFAKDVDAVIKINGKVIHPVKVDKEDFADTSAKWPDSPAYYAANVYYFNLKDIPRNAKIQFIIIYPNREEKFNIDLSKMK